MTEKRGAAGPPSSPSSEEGLPLGLHELINVLAAMRVHVFVARRSIDGAGGLDGLDGLGTGDGVGGVDGVPQVDLPRADHALGRISAMIDRALEIATDLDEQLREDGDRG